MPPPRLSKSLFANVDARIRCPTPDCFGDLLLFPTGHVDADGIPAFQSFTACPLCGTAFDLEACRAWFAERGVTRFKTPERVVRLDALPTLAAGKPDRTALRELARRA